MKKPIVAGLLLVTISLNSQATPINFLDLGGSTVDLHTGLEWLDTAATAHLRPNDLPYGINGYKWAGRERVWSLIGNWFDWHDFPNVTRSDGIIKIDGTLIDEYDRPSFDDFVATIGNGGALGRGEEIEAQFVFSGSPNYLQYYDKVNTPWFGFNYGLGNWLVRRYGEPVPEPAPWMILSLGLIGLARRFKAQGNGDWTNAWKSETITDVSAINFRQKLG